MHCTSTLIMHNIFPRITVGLCLLSLFRKKAGCITTADNDNGHAADCASLETTFLRRTIFGMRERESQRVQAGRNEPISLAQRISAMRLLHTRTLFTLALLNSIASFGTAQVPKMPPSHSLQSGIGSNPIKADFDGDGKRDEFYVAEESENTDGYFIALMSTCGRIESPVVPLCCGSVDQKGKGTLRAASKGMRGFSYWTFRWDAAAKDFRLIGYDTENFGNAMNDGSGTSSLNLLTGDFVAAFNSADVKSGELRALPKVRRKVVVSRRIYLQKFDEAADAWVADLARRNFPKEVQ